MIAEGDRNGEVRHNREIENALDMRVAYDSLAPIEGAPLKLNTRERRAIRRRMIYAPSELRNEGLVAHALHRSLLEIGSAERPKPRAVSRETRFALLYAPELAAHSCIFLTDASVRIS
jgi:hypothetical protein